MGTTFTVKVVEEGMPEPRKQAVSRAISAELEAVNRAMSTYLEDSELSRFNRHPPGEPFALSAASAEVFGLALEVAELTGGAFDITVGPLVNAWGFGPGEGKPEGLGEAEIARFLESSGLDSLDLHRASAAGSGGLPSPGGPEPTSWIKKKAGVVCDLSAIAKGYAVDQVALALQALDIFDYMVEVGGEVRARGRNGEGKIWRIGIERPQALRGAVQRIVPLWEMAMATSGDYRNIRRVGDDWVSHIIDPRGGYPVPHTLASVTVLHPSAAMADALATAFMVLGPDAGKALAEREDLAVLFLSREGERLVETSTPAFDRLATGAGLATANGKKN